MTRVINYIIIKIKSKGPNSPMAKTQFPSVKSKSTTQLLNKQYQSDSLM